MASVLTIRKALLTLLGLALFGLLLDSVIWHNRSLALILVALVVALVVGLGAVRTRIGRDSYLAAAAKETFLKAGNQANADDYINKLRENWRDVGTGLGRSIATALVLMGAFELIARAAIDKVSLGGFEISDLTIIRAALPVLVAYYFYDIVAVAYMYVDYDEVHTAVTEVMHPELLQEDLDYFVRPRPPSIVGTAFAGHHPVHGRFSLVGRIGDSLFGLVYGGILLFEMYAFFVEFRRFHSHGVIVWTSLTLAALFMLYGYLIAFSQPRSTRPQSWPNREEGGMMSGSEVYAAPAGEPLERR